MGGFERGVLGALFVTFSHFGSVQSRLAGEYDIPLLLFPPLSLEFIELPCYISGRSLYCSLDWLTACLATWVCVDSCP